MTLLTAGFVDGSRVKAEILRRALWASTNGATGVVGPADLKVLATGTPSTSVVIGAGSALIESKFANAAGNSYIVTNDQALTVSMPSTAGAYFVMLVVSDPQYAGQTAPPDPLTNAYTSVLVQSSYPSDRPFIVLARVTVPTTGGNVTNANIEDRRELANARMETDQTMKFTASNVNMSKSSYVSWPLSGFAIKVPTWANAIQIVITVNGAEYTGSDNAAAGLRIVMEGGTQKVGSTTVMKHSGAPSRQTVQILANFTLTEADRGATRYIGLQGYQVSGAGNFQQDYQSGVNYEWRFREVLA